MRACVRTGGSWLRVRQELQYPSATAPVWALRVRIGELSSDIASIKLAAIICTRAFLFDLRPERV